MIATAVVAVAAAAVGMAARPEVHDSFVVDAVFDTAKGIVPGHVVKIAGVRVGKVEDVSLTADQKARLRLKIDTKFRPFRADATCRILPEGLISENFVDCVPGTAARRLAVGRDGVPTIGIDHTTVPVDLQDVINIFTLPVDQRARAVINELGLATAGRGEDLNALLRRANPALTATRDALAILADQRKALGDAIVQSDTVLARVAAQRGAVRGFVTNANRVAGTTAAHADSLQAGVRRLLPMFTQVDRTLGAVRRLSRDGTPLLRRLRVAAPQLTRFTKTIVPFSRAGVPAVEQLGAMTARNRRDVRAATPVLARLRRFATALRAPAKQVGLLFDSLTKQGGIEALMKFGYQMAAMSGAYDSTSHYVGVVINVWANCLLRLQTVGCSQAYNAPGRGTIPANAPSLGPQRLGTKVTPDAVLTSADQARLARRHPERIKSLLDFLLK